MMIVRNRPCTYVKRSDLPERLSHVKKDGVKLGHASKKRNFATAEIDAGFYFSFRPKTERKKS